jgi:hypothetical protein
MPLPSHSHPDPEITTGHRRLRTRLIRELMQAEHRAAVHCAREAERLGHSSPAAALRACASHARSIEPLVMAIAKDSRLPISGGWLLDRALSVLRDSIADRMEEGSFRATLLELRHGLDVVRMLQHVSDASGRVELAGFCTAWLAEREPLVDAVARSMSWFAHHPVVATEHPEQAAAALHPA